MKAFAQLVACFLLLLSGSVSTIAAPYRISEIGVEGRSVNSGALNNAGQIVFSVSPELNGGMLVVPGAAFLYDRGELTDLGGLGGPLTTVSSMNEAGQIVGRTQSPDWTNQPFLYEKETGMRFLNQINERISSVHAINDLGQIVGTAISPTRGFFFENVENFTELGTLGNPWSFAFSINNLGQIVGALSTDNNTSRPFLYENGQMTDLGTLGGSREGSARAINDLGQIVGSASVASEEDEAAHAFIYDDANGMRDIGQPGEFSIAVDINNLGQVVGMRNSAADYSAFLYDEQNGRQFLIDLIDPDSPWKHLLDVYAINDRGQILGSGIIDGRRTGFLMTPIPEPSTLTLLALALLPLLRRRLHHRV